MQPGGLGRASPTRRPGLVSGHTKERAAGARHGGSPGSRAPHLVPARRVDKTRRKIRINACTCCTIRVLFTQK